MPSSTLMQPFLAGTPPPNLALPPGVPDSMPLVFPVMLPITMLIKTEVKKSAKRSRIAVSNSNSVNDRGHSSNLDCYVNPLFFDKQANAQVKYTTVKTESALL